MTERCGPELAGEAAEVHALVSNALSKPRSLPLPEDQVRALQAEEIALKAEQIKIERRLHEIAVVLVASGEARLKQRTEAHQ